MVWVLVLALGARDQIDKLSFLCHVTCCYSCFYVRLLLWDCDDRTYGYYIEVSCDQKTWRKVVDKSNEKCRSWQVIHFIPQPVTFIKIVGVNNTANEVSGMVVFIMGEKFKQMRPHPLNEW